MHAVVVKLRECSVDTMDESRRTMTALAENLEKLEETIGQACRAAGRGRGEVELMAGSKTNAAALRSACGKEDLRMHLIGHLQSNKAARAVELFDAIDSVDSLRLAERLNEAAEKLGKRLPVLIEVKLSPEETKAGLNPGSDEAARLLERLPDLEDLETQGLMT